MNSEDSSGLINLEKELIDGLTPSSSQKEIEIPKLEFMGEVEINFKKKLKNDEEGDAFINKPIKIDYTGTFGKASQERGKVKKPSRFKPLQLNILSPIPNDSKKNFK